MEIFDRSPRVLCDKCTDDDLKDSVSQISEFEGRICPDVLLWHGEGMMYFI